MSAVSSYECPICLDGFEQNQKTLFHAAAKGNNSDEKVEHVFHQTCLSEYFSSFPSSSCPLCRAEKETFAEGKFAITKEAESETAAKKTSDKGKELLPAAKEEKQLGKPIESLPPHPQLSNGLEKKSLFDDEKYYSKKEIAASKPQQSHDDAPTQPIRCNRPSQAVRLAHGNAKELHVALKEIELGLFFTKLHGINSQTKITVEIDSAHPPKILRSGREIHKQIVAIIGNNQKIFYEKR